MNSYEETYDLVTSHVREAAILESIQELLEWDERTKMPAAGGNYRADQAAYVAGLEHRKQTDPRLGEWLTELAESPLAADQSGDTGTVIRHLRREYDKQTRKPQKLVEELTRAAVEGQQIWAAARKANNFAAFQPILEKMVDLKKQEAAALGFETTPYDPLLDDYEPGESTENIAHVLSNLRDALVPLVQAIAESGQRPDVSILERTYPADAQESFGKQAAAAICFDFTAGRLDSTDHPFCCMLGPNDVRLTTRYDEHWFSDCFFSILHEAGHGIYDQGLPAEHYGLPTGEYVSLGIHESQSRLWENQVGRSRAFWEHFFPSAQQAFPQALGDVTREAFYGAINDVRPSLIRVEADEVTYNLHILIRFELEKALLEDQLSVADLPGAWDEKYMHYLGVASPTADDGVLQDVHWSAGLFGYFPTYALGNLYSAQFFGQAQEDLGDLDAQFRRGEFSNLREWLREKIHRHGKRYSAAELAERITGKPLSHQALIQQLSVKYGELYGL
ncbi:carboxypeptidase M32 [Bythopirellula goksoeyrii]|uniref:Metal-dependent carboxypeptidase n=1 Tax=Bythopirellula goksoeyrii TaxID=1400387 RepID=A0A5B9QAT5_9BACT|nr:carboxypeptidase M32 [Bythopirellula goksoeyrii]QEG34016.1 Thermostable carboxypeptidase 1 [Bythopirellula goksoeyrii]